MKQETRYYEGSARDPLEAVDKILNSIQNGIRYTDRDELEFYDVDGNVTDEGKGISPLQFSVTMYTHEDNTYWNLAGTVMNRGWADDLGSVWDAGAELEILEFP